MYPRLLGVVLSIPGYISHGMKAKPISNTVYRWTDCKNQLTLTHPENKIKLV